ncbi:MAG: hypothetical protein BEN18_10310 [Epulopiscium sp. Nuni2H_MBin001]|nr:MAG: hypothetical protein BEN18_10310 [Epulopiscium sp. Nuni2H_MBin001]
MKLKAIIEKRNSKLTELEVIYDTVVTETRAFTQDEEIKYEQLKKEIDDLDKTITTLKSTIAVEERALDTKDDDVVDINRELRAIFGENLTELRALNTTTNNQGGYVVTQVLSNKIIKAATTRSNAIEFFDLTSISGNLRFPKKLSGITATWEAENSINDPQASTPTIEIIELGQHRLYAESAITQQMINSQEIDLENFIVEEISDGLANAIEDAIFNGSGTKQPKGIGIGLTKKIDCTDISMKVVKQAFHTLAKSQQNKAKWFMHTEMFLVLDNMTDEMGRPLLQPNLAKGTGYMLLGRPIEVSDCINISTIYFACPDAYHTNLQKDIALHIYTDSTYTKRGLIGYAADIYLDGITKNDDAIVCITCED